MGRGDCVIDRLTCGREDRSSELPLPFLNYGISFSLRCLHLSEETPEAVGPLYMVSMSGRKEYVLLKDTLKAHHGKYEGIKIRWINSS